MAETGTALFRGFIYGHKPPLPNTPTDGPSPKNAERPRRTWHSEPFTSDREAAEAVVAEKTAAAKEGNLWCRYTVVGTGKETSVRGYRNVSGEYVEPEQGESPPRHGEQVYTLEEIQSGALREIAFTSASDITWKERLERRVQALCRVLPQSLIEFDTTGSIFHATLKTRYIKFVCFDFY